MDKQVFVAGNKVTQTKIEKIQTNTEAEIGKIVRESGLWGIIDYDTSPDISMDLSYVSGTKIATIKAGNAYSKQGVRLTLSSDETIDFNSAVTVATVFSGEIVENDVSFTTETVYVYLRVWEIEDDAQSNFQGETVYSTLTASARYYVSETAPDSLDVILQNVSICVGAIDLNAGTLDDDDRESLYQDTSGNHYYNIKDLAAALFASAGGSGVFEKSGSLIRLASALVTYAEDYVFGSTDTEYDGNSAHDARIIFDKSKGAFRAGIAEDTYWDDANRGDYSAGLGKNIKASGEASLATGERSEATHKYEWCHGIHNKGDKSFRLNQLQGSDTAVSFNLTVDGTDGITLEEYRAYALKITISTNDGLFTSPIYSVITAIVQNLPGKSPAIDILDGAICENFNAYSDITFDIDLSNDDLQITVTNPDGKDLNLTAKVEMIQYAVS